jgi:hypothetical protein
MQGQYSLTYREEEREMIGYCKAFGIGLIPWGPLAAGQLARPWSATESGTTRTAADAKMPWATDAEAHEKAIVQRVEEVAGKKGWTMGQVALAWIGGKVTSPIIGFSSVKRMEEAIIPGYKLTEEEVKYLEEPCVRLPRWHCPRLTRLQIPPYGRPRARVSAPSLPICTHRCNAACAPPSPQLGLRTRPSQYGWHSGRYRSGPYRVERIQDWDCLRPGSRSRPSR